MKSEELKQHILGLEKELIETQQRTAILQGMIRQLYQDYEKTCPHTVFQGYRDSDGHNTVRTYICKECKYQTKYAPPEGSTIEWEY